MRIDLFKRRRSEQGSIVAYFIFLVVIATATASVCAFVAQTLNVSHRRNDMAAAQNLAVGGVALAAAELESASTNQSASLLVNLSNNPAGAYAKNIALSTAQSNVYQRTITSPFSSGSVTAQIWTTPGSTPSAARIVGTTTVGKATQSASLVMQMSFGYGAAVISDNFGANGNGVSKADAQKGNVVFKANSHPTIIVDGGNDYAVRANGSVNVGNNVTVQGAISEENANTANEIPDYTAEGAVDQLFDFSRFIAAADLTPSGPSPSKNNHFTNMTAFRASLKTNSAANPYQGVVVVDIRKYVVDEKKGKSVDSGDFDEVTTAVAPNGINVQGTVVFNFAQDVSSSDKLVISADLKLNPANLSGLNPANPATYTTGYPATYSTPAKNPVNIDITSKGFQNFAAGDDLPALMYNIGILDIHGNANVSGVVYSPSFMEIENHAGIQYFKGSLIGGGGVFVENKDYTTNIISYDASALDLLATSGNKAKRLKAMYWQ